jgi:hypothetical protein
MGTLMKKDYLDYFVYYFGTGVVVITAMFLIGQALDNFRIAINMILIMLGVLILGAVVYEGINYIYKKWWLTKNKE